MAIPKENLRLSKMNEWLHIYFPLWFAAATILDLLLLGYIAFHR